jgi:hypothetical protein
MEVPITEHRDKVLGKHTREYGEPVAQPQLVTHTKKKPRGKAFAKGYDPRRWVKGRLSVS